MERSGKIGSPGLSRSRLIAPQPEIATMAENQNSEMTHRKGKSRGKAKRDAIRATKAALAERDRMLHPPVAWTLEQEAMAELDREALAHMRDL